MYCKKCGKEYPKTKKVCSDCGMALMNGTAPSSRKQKVNKVPMIVFGGIVVVLIAVFLIIGLS
jgi:predicted nucleic acid-binding Zn ribbon protein